MFGFLLRCAITFTNGLFILERLKAHKNHNFGSNKTTIKAKYFKFLLNSMTQQIDILRLQPWVHWTLRHPTKTCYFQNVFLFMVLFFVWHQLLMMFFDKFSAMVKCVVYYQSTKKISINVNEEFTIICEIVQLLLYSTPKLFDVVSQLINKILILHV